MPVKRRQAKHRRAVLTDAQWHVLTDQPDESLDAYLLEGPPYGEATELHGLWDAHKASLLPRWVQRYPGTRPSCWWRWDAPREPLGTRPGWHDDGTLPEPRRRQESQASYLKRHGLLLPGEARRLKAADFEPETLVLPGASSEK
jgi:hypothetical protein